MIMKKIFRILLGLFAISALVTSCGEGIIIQGNGGDMTGVDNTMDCDWDNMITARFMDVHLLATCSNGECDNRFSNYLLDDALISWSLYRLMFNCRNGCLGGHLFDFKWTITVVAEKTCSVASDQSRNVLANQDDYDLVFRRYNEDVIESPFMSSVPPAQHKHKLEFQIHGIQNAYDGTIGTIKWEYTWISPSSVIDGEWWFLLPNAGLAGTFIPDAYQQHVIRHIYINGQYEDI
jgi:hypothetical protein